MTGRGPPDASGPRAPTQAIAFPRGAEVPMPHCAQGASAATLAIRIHTNSVRGLFQS